MKVTVVALVAQGARCALEEYLKGKGLGGQVTMTRDGYLLCAPKNYQQIGAAVRGFIQCHPEMKIAG